MRHIIIDHYFLDLDTLCALLLLTQTLSIAQFSGNGLCAEATRDNHHLGTRCPLYD